MPWGNPGFLFFRNIYKLGITFVLMVKEVQKKVSQPKQVVQKSMVQKSAVQLESVTIKKIGVLSLANLFAVLNLFFGLIVGIFVTLVLLLFPEQLTVGGIAAFLISPFSIIIFPILFGIMGWFSGLIVGLFYNLTAKITKGAILYS